MAIDNKFEEENEFDKLLEENNLEEKSLEELSLPQESSIDQKMASPQNLSSMNQLLQMYQEQKAEQRAAEQAKSEQIKDVNQRKALLDMFAGINRGAARIGQAMAGRYSGQFSPDVSGIDKNLQAGKTLLDSMATQPTKAKDGMQDFLDIYRLNQADQRIGALSELEKGRERRFGESKKLREEAQRMTEEKEKRIARQQQIDTARNYLKDDPRFKKSIEQSMAFEDVNRLIDLSDAGNQAAVAALGTRLARAMGEVGVLTDTDVVRYVAGKSWGRKLLDWYAGGMKGQISEETLNDIRENVGALKNKLNMDVNRVYSHSSDRMKTAYPDLDDQTIKGLLGLPIGLEQKEKKKERKPESDKKQKTAPYGDTVERDGKKYKWNSSVGKYQLISE